MEKNQIILWGSSTAFMSSRMISASCLICSTAISGHPFAWSISAKTSSREDLLDEDIITFFELRDDARDPDSPACRRGVV